MIYFAPVRREMAAKGFSEAAIGALEAIASAATDASAAVNGSATDLTALQDDIASLQAEVAALEIAAADASLLVPVQWFSPDLIAVLTDLDLLTESGDIIFTEDGDHLLVEA